MTLSGFLDFIILSLATYRITHMMVGEVGPFRAFEIWREFLYNRVEWGWVKDGFNCVLCLSFWLSIIFFLIYLKIGTLPFVPIGVSGATLIIHKVIYS